MTREALVAASRQELDLYRELWAVYDRLSALVAEGPVDVSGIATDGARAAAVTQALRDLGATLTAHRLSPQFGPDAEISALWRESATLAAAAADANRRLQASARARQASVRDRLVSLHSAAPARRGYQAAAASAR